VALIFYNQVIKCFWARIFDLVLLFLKIFLRPFFKIILTITLTLHSPNISPNPGNPGGRASASLSEIKKH
jgi:hypothetical protein